MTTDIRYKSLIHGNSVTPSQYLSELMCKRLAEKNKEKLVDGFWNIARWRVLYKQQIMAANSLLKIYPATVIISTVNRKDFLWVYSLRSPQLSQGLIEEFDKYKKLQERMNDKVIAPKIDVPEIQIVKPASSINKKKNIRNIDG
jgi:hypothetical protein